MKVCLIGAGRWGKNYIQTLKQTMFELVAIVDPLYQGDLKSYKSIEDIQEEYEVAIIATPMHTHYTLAKQLLFMNKHILLEKPLSLSSETSKELIELAKKQNKTMMVGYNVLYLPIYQHIKAEYILSYSSQRTVEYDNSNTHILHDLLCHDIAIISKIFQRKPDKVEYIGTTQQGTLLLRYGIIVLSCFASRFKEKRRSILCRNKDKFIEIDDLNKTIIDERAKSYKDETPPLLAQCNDFYDHIVNQKEHKENLLISLIVDEVIEEALK